MTETKKTEAKPETVRVRVLKKGHEQVHNGEGGVYAKGDEFDIDPEIALALEEAGLVDTL